jgi:D-threo-aldose 1-dehydrogenase
MRNELGLPRLGFGGAAIGNLYAPRSEAEVQGVIAAAVAAGIEYFDTAPHYGFSLSETRLGVALEGREVLLSTKVGRRLEPVVNPAREREGFVDAAPFASVFDYSYDGVMSAFEDSLGRLRREHVDILLAHDLGAMTHGAAHAERLREFLDGGYRAMVELRNSGRVRAIGLGVNEQAICETVLDHADLDVILLAGRYTLLEQTPLDSFLPRCLERNVGVIIGGPFNSGALVEPQGALHYDYAPASAAIAARVASLRAVCAAHGVPLAAAALQFPLAHPAVMSVIPGISSASQVTDALHWLGLDLPPALWSDLRSEGLIHFEAPTPRGAS